MGKTGRLYSPEFKEEAVRLVHSSEDRYPVAKIARDLDGSAIFFEYIEGRSYSQDLTGRDPDEAAPKLDGVGGDAATATSMR